MKKSEPAAVDPDDPKAALGLPTEILESLPEDARISIVKAASLSGPLPPPAMYESYEKTLPGSANRIMTLAEDEQRHRAEWEDNVLDAVKGDTERGQHIGAALAIVCVGGAIYLASNGEQIVAAIPAGVSARGLAGRFLFRMPGR